MKLPPGHVPGQGVLKPSGYGGFGERMMRSMGWEKGQGLGKNADGIKEAIQVKKKEDTVGVGGNASWKWEEKYWEAAYESVQLNTQDIDSSDGSSSDDSSDDDDNRAAFADIAAAGATVNRDGTLSSASAQELRLLKALSKGPGTGRFGGRQAKMARIREQEAKLAAEYAARLGVSVATTTAATTATTTVAAAAGGSDRSETTSEVRLPSTEAGAAAGAPSGGTSAAAAGAAAGGDVDSKAGKKAKKRARGGEGEAAVGAGAGGSEKKRKKDGRKGSGEGAARQQRGQQEQPQQLLQGDAECARAAGPKQRICIEPAVEDSAPLAEFQPTVMAGWWGASRFVSAGCLEGAKKDVQGTKGRMVFTEGDQERVYMAAHAGKVARGTKKGLGQSQAVGKVGGVKWAGSKVTFQDEDGGGEAAAKEKAPRLAAIGSSTHLDQVAAAGCSGSGGAAAAAARRDGEPGSNSGEGCQEGAEGREAGWQAGVKWKKLITKALQGAPGGRLKLKELQSQVAAAVLEMLAKGGEAPAGVGKREVRAAVAARLSGSRRFAVEGKHVLLRGG